MGWQAEQKGLTALAPVNFRRPTLNFQHTATNRATAISLYVAPRRPRAVWLHAHAHDLARAQSACAAGILGTRPRRRARRQTGIQKGADAGRQADKTIARAKGTVTCPEQLARGAARRNILVSANAGLRRLPAGPGRAVRRLSNLRPRPLRNMGSLATRQDCGCRPSAQLCGRANTKTGRAGASSATGHGICSSFTPTASS
jgi:hypothetical protein